jgi:hypothetical protein
VLHGLDGTGYDVRHEGFHEAGHEPAPFFHAPGSSAGSGRMHFVQGVMGSGTSAARHSGAPGTDPSASAQPGLYFSADDLGLLPPMPASSDDGQYPRGGMPPLRRGVTSLAV